MPPRTNPADTWFGVLLDGLIGGLIGGAATGAAVWWTLQHTQLLADKSSGQDVAARLTLNGLRFAQAEERHGIDSEEVDDAMLSMQASAMEFAARVARLCPYTAVAIRTDGMALVQAFNLEDKEAREAAAMTAATTLSSLSSMWLLDSSGVEKALSIGIHPVNDELPENLVRVLRDPMRRKKWRRR